MASNGDDPKTEETVTEPIEPQKVNIEFSLSIDEKQYKMTITPPIVIENPQKPANEEEAKSDKRFELYKLEYTTGVQRYEDIYKSLWTIFNYMAILAGGILAFGKGSGASHNLIIAIACVPLLFWFWATYLPLDSYGKLVEKRMKAIEELFNKNYDATLSLYTNVQNRGWFRIRVKYIIVILAIILHLTFYSFITKYNTETPLPPKPTTEENLESINNTLKSLSNSRNEIINQTNTNNSLENSRGTNNKLKDNNEKATDSSQK